jgi:hypothetical protein
MKITGKLVITTADGMKIEMNEAEITHPPSPALEDKLQKIFEENFKLGWDAGSRAIDGGIAFAE